MIVPRSLPAALVFVAAVVACSSPEASPATTGVPATYTGVAATWQRNAVADGVAFIVELGATLSPEEAAVHAAAVLDVALLSAE